MSYKTDTVESAACNQWRVGRMKCDAHQTSLEKIKEEIYKKENVRQFKKKKQAKTENTEYQRADDICSSTVL